MKKENNANKSNETKVKEAAKTTAENVPHFENTTNALESLKAVLAEVNAKNAEIEAKRAEVTTIQLQKAVAIILNGGRQFSKSPLKFNAIFAGAFKLLEDCKATKKYCKNIRDYVLHNAGVVQSEEGYELQDGKALDSACKSYKEVALKDYKSSETIAAETKAKEEKATAKQAFKDASAKQQAALLINTTISDYKAKAAKAKNEDALKMHDVITYLEKAVTYLDKASV